jgi:hypothetical protein
LVPRLKDFALPERRKNEKLQQNTMFGFERSISLEGYDPRIHAVYFCPQLYKYDSEKKLLPLQGDEIGRLIAKALESGIVDRRPWYEPAEKLPDQPIISVPCRPNMTRS